MEKEYEVYVPVHYNDGTPIEPRKIESIGERLLRQFGGLTYFPQENQGVWKMGGVTFRDKIVLFRVLTDKPKRAEQFLRKLKADLKRELKQEQILIVSREVGKV